jgi:hypothetical protein
MNGPTLVILEVLPFSTYTLAPAVLPLLEAPLEKNPLLVWLLDVLLCGIKLPLRAQNDDP